MYWIGELTIDCKIFISW